MSTQLLDSRLNADRPLIMGVLNMTPDSFYTKSRHSVNSAIDMALQMQADGADIIDIGGESTRPYATPITVEEELARVIPVIKQLSKEVQVISVDTSKPEVMQQAIDLGVKLINDIRALQQDGALQVVANTSVHVCIMHALGEPCNMQDNPHYTQVITQVYEFLQWRLQACIAAGIKRSRIIIDPGFGFGKTVRHNYQLLANLDRFSQLAPTLIGISRKSMIGKVLDIPCDERLPGSLAAATIAYLNGAKIIRTHDVAATKQAMQIAKMAIDSKEVV